MTNYNYFRGLWLWLCLIPAVTSAQTINLNTNSAGKTGITLDDQLLYSNNINNLDIPAKGAIRFKLNNLGHKTLLIRLYGKDDLLPAGAVKQHLDESGLPAILASANLISTDESLNLSVAGHTYNLNRPFAITLGVAGDPANTFTAIFIPQTAKVVAGAAGAAPAAQPAAAVITGPQPPKPTVYHPGSAVYDAITLTHPEAITVDQFLKIMAAYYPNIAAYNDVTNAVQQNPFLSSVFSPNYNNQFKPDLTLGSQSASTVSSVPSLSSIGGLDVTNYVDGLAKFLVKRTKQELSSAFFEKLKEKINNIPDLKTLLPQTTTLLNSVGEQVYNYQQYLQNLRAAFKSDLDALDANLPGIINNHAVYFTRQHTLAAAITGSCYLIAGLRKQQHPGDLIANYPIGSLKLEPEAWTGAFQTVQLLSQSFRDTSGTDAGYWVDVKFVRQLLADKQSFRIYLGLLYQEALKDYDGVSYDTNTSFLSLLDNLGVNYDNDVTIYQAYKQYVMNFAQKISTVNQLVKTYQKPANDSLAVEQYKKYFDATMDLVRFTISAADLPDANSIAPAALKFKAEATPYLNITDNVAGLATSINRKNYAGAVNEVLNVYDEIYTKPLNLELAAAAGPAAITAAQNAVQLSANIRTEITRYGGFVAVVATAKTSDDIETAIESFVLPPGSSSVKRESPFNVALNAYTGLFYGHEHIQGVNNNVPWLNTYGVTAPVGVSISFGQRQFFWPFNGGGHSSVSLFVSLIDIGTVAAYRFKDDQTSQVPTIHLKDIFSPGVFLSLGIPKTPLSINFGAQTGPTLREITMDNNGQPVAEADSRLYWRFSASLVVDLPLLNLYTKSK